MKRLLSVNVKTYEKSGGIVPASVEVLNHNLEIITVLRNTNTKETSSNSTEYFSYKDVIENAEDTSKNYIIQGICSKIKNKYFFNGTGLRKKTTNDLDGNKIEITYTVYSKMQGELCKNGNIKITLDEENGSAHKANVDGKEIDNNYSYSSESNFCLKNNVK